jgi:HK97 family phage major capsid protein
MAENEPDLKAVAEAVVEVKKGFEQFKEAAATREKELLTKGDVDPLIEEKLAKINEDLNQKQELIDKLYVATKRKNIQLDGKSVTEEELNLKAREWAQIAFKRRGIAMPDDLGHEQVAEYKSAFGQFLRKGDTRMMEPEEAKAMSVYSDPDGGFFVDPDTSGRMVQKVFETSEIRAYASTQVISTDALEGSFDLEEAGYGWVGETGARTETTTPQVKIWRIPVHEMWAMPQATQKLLDDANVDVQGWLASKVSDRFARAENTAFVNGTGTDRPRGFLTYADGTTLPGTIEQFKTAADGAFASTPSGADKLVEMIYGMKAQYRRGASWAMNRTTLGGVRLLKNSDGQMLWQPSIAAGQPSQLLGYPIASFEDMPDYTTTDALAIAFADWAEAYQIVDRAGISLLIDPYTSKPFVKFYSRKRTGGDVVNFEAIKLLKFGS